MKSRDVHFYDNLTEQLSQGAALCLSIIVCVYCVAVYISCCCRLHDAVLSHVRLVCFRVCVLVCVC